MAVTTEAAPRETVGYRANWVRLRTLVLLRWMAVAGQLAAIAGADWIYGISVPILPALLLIGLSILANLFSSFVFARSHRLSGQRTLLALCFDCTQLVALLFLTGGLNNPFALLILAPATIAATALEARATAIVCGLTIVLVSLLAWFHWPLVRADGTPIIVPSEFAVGFWLAIVIGVLFLALYARRISTELHAMGDALLAAHLALGREQQLTALTAVVAATAHELGTPLATIKLTSTELVDELSDRPELRADAELIREQADRCRDILHDMGRSGKDDLHMRTVPLQALIEEAAEPHARRGANLVFVVPKGTGNQPLIRRSAEIVHAMRNLIQNAVDFAHATVWIELNWSAEIISVTVFDDGPGFPPQLIDRIGDPYMRTGGRSHARAQRRKGYKGMGMGLFIAKTLLERTGAKLAFSNLPAAGSPADDRAYPTGASVRVVWPRDRIESRANATGANPPMFG